MAILTLSYPKDSSVCKDVLFKYLDNWYDYECDCQKQQVKFCVDDAVLRNELYVLINRFPWINISVSFYRKRHIMVDQFLEKDSDQGWHLF